MSRIRGWEKNLALVIEKHNMLPMQYGISDCYIIADDAVQALTGKIMFTGVRNYKSQAGALKKLRKHGFLTVEDAFSHKFPRIPVLMAQRGDIGVVYQSNGEVSGGVFTSQGFFTKTENGSLFLAYNQVTYAFGVR